MKYKMMVSDLDGTMFDWSMTAHVRNKLSIKKALGKGVVFIIATGRPPYSAISIAESLGIDNNSHYIIYFNGGGIAKAGNGEIIREYMLDSDDAQYIIKHAKGFGGDIVAYINSKPYSINKNHYTEEYARMTGGTIIYGDGFEDTFESGYNKILIKGERNELEKIRISLSDWADGRVSCFYSSEGLLEFVSTDVSKGAAMVAVANMLGIDTAEIVAIGDYYNDLSMIKAAGMGIATKDAPEDIKSAADYVTENSAAEGAVSEVIEKFIL